MLISLRYQRLSMLHQLTINDPDILKLQMHTVQVVCTALAILTLLCIEWWIKIQLVIGHRLTLPKEPHPKTQKISFVSEPAAAAAASAAPPLRLPKMAGRRRGDNRVAGQADGGRGQQLGGGQAGGGRGQQLGGGQAGGGRAAGQAGGGRGEHPGAALPGGHQHQAQRGQHTLLEKNQNRPESPERKIIKSGSPFLSEYTTTKLKNKELERIYDELKGYKAMMSEDMSAELYSQILVVYNQLLDNANIIRDKIKEAKGMALPIPKLLVKKLKP